jgi:hypothetical protein
MKLVLGLSKDNLLKLGEVFLFFLSLNNSLLEIDSYLYFNYNIDDA